MPDDMAHRDEAELLEIGRKVELLREQRGWSRETLAYNAGVSQKTVSRIANGEVEARRSSYRALAAALEVPEYAIVGEPKGPQGVPLSEQIGGGFEEFREYVHGLEERLERIEEKLDRALGVTTPPREAGAPRLPVLPPLPPVDERDVPAPRPKPSTSDREGPPARGPRRKPA